MEEREDVQERNRLSKGVKVEVTYCKPEAQTSGILCKQQWL